MLYVIVDGYSIWKSAAEEDLELELRKGWHCPVLCP